MKYRFCSVLLCIVFAAGLSFAADAPAERNKLPIKILSNELQTDNTAQTATFTGKVSAKQGDVTIYSDKLVIHYTKGQDVEQIEAFGNVRIVQLNRLGAGDYGLYESKIGKMTLKGNPKVYEGKSVVTGNVITYFVDEEKSLVTSAPDKRVDAVLYPKDRDAKDKDAKDKDPKGKDPKGKDPKGKDPKGKPAKEKDPKDKDPKDKAKNDAKP
jgi:lipopolysaccharide export system protein LptA